MENRSKKLKHLQNTTLLEASDKELSGISGGAGGGDSFFPVEGYVLNRSCSQCQRDCWTCNGHADSTNYLYFCAVCKAQYRNGDIVMDTAPEQHSKTVIPISD